MSERTLDVLVIGAGPAGVLAALRAADAAKDRARTHVIAAAPLVALLDANGIPDGYATALSRSTNR